MLRHFFYLSKVLDNKLFVSFPVFSSSSLTSREKWGLSLVTIFHNIFLLRERKRYYTFSTRGGNFYLRPTYFWSKWVLIPYFISILFESHFNSAINIMLYVSFSLKKILMCYLPALTLQNNLAKKQRDVHVLSGQRIKCNYQ